MRSGGFRSGPLLLQPIQHHVSGGRRPVHTFNAAVCRRRRTGIRHSSAFHGREKLSGEVALPRPELSRLSQHLLSGASCVPLAFFGHVRHQA
jgi:hypothetical protein